VRFGQLADRNKRSAVPAWATREVFARVVSGQKSKRRLVEAVEQVFGRPLLRAIAGGPPMGVQKSVVLHGVATVFCDWGSMFGLRRRAKAGDFTFLLVEFFVVGCGLRVKTLPFPAPVRLPCQAARGFC